MNGNAVITNEDGRRKWPMFGPALYPRVAVVDPAVQFSLPWCQTVNGAIDAMAHVLEFSFTGTDQETTLAVNEGLQRSIVRCVDRLQADGRDYPARASLAWAATLALNGISGAGMPGDWAVHYIEHALSAVRPDIAHGSGLGVLFPAYALHLHAALPEAFERWAGEVWGADGAAAGVAAMRARLKAWGAAVTLEDLGLGEADIEQVINGVAEYRDEVLGGRLGGIRLLGDADVREILTLCLAGNVGSSGSRACS